MVRAMPRAWSIAPLCLTACFHGAPGGPAGAETTTGGPAPTTTGGSAATTEMAPGTGEPGSTTGSTAGPTGSSGAAVETVTGTSTETGIDEGTGGSTESGGATDAGGEEASSSSGEPFPPEALACEYAFFTAYFEMANGTELPALRDQAFAAISARAAELQACAPGVTLGGLLSLLVFEGAARVAMYNTKCAENSYDDSPTCFATPKARYSYQFGLAPVHTSNFHPCADVVWTGKMRERLQAALDAAGFVPPADAIAGVAAEVQTFCPDASPTAVDYYILTAHSAFGVPTDAAGNDLEHAGEFPFFTPGVMIDLFFATLLPACAQISGDNDVIAVFGGGDASYDDPAKQAQILAPWGDWQASHCP